ncbi:hypothetical protein KJK41_20190 [Bacillus haikouensis]|nr:hypothetical protein KJK41_20190 [Bacillus haikouensis]
MLGKYMKYNVKLLPAYFAMSLIFIVGILLTGERETYFYDMAAVILQITVILMIPNLVYLIRHRKVKGNIIGFIAVILVIPMPFTFIAAIMRMIYI